jgi:beta-glucanase (GH16 family)
MKTTIMRVLALAAIALPLGLKAQGSFLDDCTTFDSSLWNIANYGMGRGSMLPADFAPSGGGVYNFELPANTYNGAEIYSKAQYGYGKASTSMKCCGLQGVLNSIYMYQGVGSSSDEIDIETYKNDGGTWEIAFTVYKAGVKEWVKVYYPSWDPSAGYNTYTIDYESTGVTLYVNGAVEGQFTTGGKLPTHAMNIQLIAWWPTWLTADKSGSNEYMQTNWISFTAN